MKLFGSLKELVSVVFRKNSQEITLRPNQATTYTAARDIQTPPQDANSVLVSESATQTLTNKTMGSTNTLTGATAASFTNSGAVSLPSGVDTLVGRVSSDTGANRLQNKELSDNNVLFVDEADTTKKMAFQVSGVTTGTTRTLTVPNASTTIVGTDATQTLTNKTLQADLVDDYLDFNEESAPSTPAANTSRMYVKSDGKFYSKDDAGIERQLGGGGAGEKNYISDSDSVGAGWVASGAGVTVATTTTAADLPEESKGTGIKITGVSGTDYARYRFTIDDTDKSKKMKIQFALKSASAYTANDFEVQMFTNTASNYGGTYTQLTLSTDDVIKADAGFTYLTAFDSSTADYYELRIKRNAGTSFIVISGVITGPGLPVQGAAVGGTVDGGTITIVGATTNPTKGSVSYDKIWYNRDGEYMEAYFEFKGITGGSEGSGAYLITVPGGYTLDTTKIANTVGDLNSQSLGQAIFQAAGGGTEYVGYLFYIDVGGGKKGLSAYVMPESGGAMTQWSGSSIGITGSTRAGGRFRIPIAEWSGAATVALGPASNIEYASTSGTWDANDSTTQYGPNGAAISGAISAIRTKTITWQYGQQDGDLVYAQLRVTGANEWHTVGLDMLQGNQRGAMPMNRTSSGGTVFGVGIKRSSATTLVDIGTKYGAYLDGDTGSHDWGNGDYDRWRIVKVSSTVPVGLPRATASTLGLAQMSDVIDITSQLSGSNSWSTTGASAVVFSDRTGLQWGINFTFSGTNAGTATGVGTVSVAGVTFKTGIAQGFGGTCNVSPFVAAMQPGGGANSFFLATASGSPTNWRGSGFIWLDSKPTWA